MTKHLENRVALVTGAARGQGRSHATRLAGEGADIIAVDLCEDIPEAATYRLSTPEDLRETVRVVESVGRQIIPLRIDVRDASAMRAGIDQAVAELGRLDTVVANAGIGSAEPIEKVSTATWNAVIDTNLTGVWNTCRAAIPHLIAGGAGGSIVITSSALGLRGMQNTVAYSSSKHAVVGLMRALAVELGIHNIRVNTLHPSQVDTPMIMHADMYKLFAPDLPDPTREDFAVRSQGMHVLPIPWLQPIDISEAVLYLASDAARYITGVTLPVDAGNSIR